MKISQCLLFVFFPLLCFSQSTGLSVSKWATDMADATDKQNIWYEKLYSQLSKLDSANVMNFLSTLEKSAKQNNYFSARFKCIKADMVYLYGLTENKQALKLETDKKVIKDLLSQAMNEAYDNNDDYLTAFVSGKYGSYMHILGEMEAAMMYLTNCTDLYEKLNESARYGIYMSLGEMMWKVREYDKCIKYTKKGFSMLWAFSKNEKGKKLYAMFSNNTIGLAYHRMNMYDSAFVYYHKALDAQASVDAPAWKGFISGNMAQIYFAQGKYQTALPLFQMDYTLSKKHEVFDNAGNSLQWAAKTNLALGKKDSALLQVREALGLLHKWPQANYVQNACYTAAEVFKALNNNDSSFYYTGLYNKIHDSIERVVYQSSINIARLRLAEENNKYSILKLQQEKKEQIKQRNFIIAAIIGLSCLILLLINRRNQKLKFQQQLATQEKKRIEQEMQAAKDQLQLFTQNLIAKTELVEKLEQQMQDNAHSAERQQSLSALNNFTILTDDDWTKFRNLFEKIYPLFFQQLKTKSPDITSAEQRMAALTRLQLTTKQMASMQGVSPDSVHKTRQRLRQRLGISNEVNLEEYLSGI